MALTLCAQMAKNGSANEGTRRPIDCDWTPEALGPFGSVDIQDAQSLRAHGSPFSG